MSIINSSHLQFLKDVSWPIKVAQDLDNFHLQGVQECSIPCFRKILKISNPQ